MAVEYPTPQDIKQAFAGALPAGGQFDQEQWNRLYKGAANPQWVDAGNGIQTLQANGARLVRVVFEFGIDKMKPA
jgi:hypothetical protein